MTTTDVQPSAVETLAGRIFSTGVGAAELCTAYLGIHLGLYRSLADSPATAAAPNERKETTTSTGRCRAPIARTELTTAAASNPAASVWEGASAAEPP